MTRYHLGWPGTMGLSLLAALTSWVTLWAWSGFTERASGFLVPALGGCLLIAVTGMLLRSARLAAPVVLLGQVAVLLVWATHQWAPAGAYGGWVPTPASFERLGDVLAAGARAAQAYSAPVPETVDQVHPLLVVGGVATGVVVDFLACGLRRAPAAGLPLLAVYSAPVSILPEGVPWWGFAAGAIGFVFLLAGEQGRRLGHWGRVVSQSSVSDSLATSVRNSSLLPSARRIGLTATGLAVAAPVLVPTLPSGLLDGIGTGGGGTGGDVTITNPMVDLKRDLALGRDVDLLRVRTDGDPSYLRMSVLDSFDGETWKPSDRNIPSDQRANGPLPNPPGLQGGVRRTEVDWHIAAAEQFESQWLPAPYPATSIETVGDWRYDLRTLDFLSADEDVDARGMDYLVSGLTLDVSADELADAGASPADLFAENTALPTGLPDTVPRLARELTGGMESRFEKAVRLQQWFRDDGGFRYSLRRAPGNGTDDLVRFLSDGPGGRVGYCEQFAAAMAVMGRSIGIPSRVAVGFLRPTRVAEDTYVYSAHDMHAWPEMYFDGVGWVRFEPTPQGRTGSVPAYTAGQNDPAAPTAAPTGAATSRAPDEITRPTQGPDPGAAAGGRGSGGSGRGLLVGFLGGLLLTLATVVPWALRSWVRIRRWAVATTGGEAAEAAWSELRDTALDLGLPWDDSVTLRTRARSLAASFGEPERGTEEYPTRGRRRGPDAAPDAARALERVVQHLERARFARHVEDRAEARADVAICTRALYDGASRRRRFRATWLPASLVRSLRSRERQRKVAAPLAEPGLDRAV